MKLYAEGGQFFADGFAVRNSFSLEEGESRCLSYLSEVGCGAAKLTIKQGELIVQEGSVGVIYGRDYVRLFPLPVLRPWERRAEKEFSTRMGKVRVSLFAGEPSLLLVSGAFSFKYTPRYALCAPKITLIEGQRFPILRVDAFCRAGDYVALLALREEGVTLLLEECGECVTCEGNEIRVERSYADALSRKTTSRYLWKGNGFECSREIVCAKEHIFIREEMGRALLEAVMAKDEKGIDDLLSPEINDPAAMIAYFGDLVALRPALDANSDTAVIAVKREGNRLVATTYDFEFDEYGRIGNVRNQEE